MRFPRHLGPGPIWVHGPIWGQGPIGAGAHRPGVGFWIPRSTFWPADLFGSKKWSRKKLFCGGMILWWGFRGIHPAQMNSMVPGTHMGRLLCPKQPLFHYLVGIPSFPGKLQVAPASLAYFPLWGPAPVAEGLRINTCHA